MRDILKKIFIGIVIGMSLFFLKTQVFALETTAFQVYSSNQSGYFGFTNTTRNYVNLPFSYNFTNSSGYDYLQFSVSATMLVPYQTDSSSVYTNYFRYPLIIGAYIVGNNSTAYCESTLSSIKCPLNKDTTYSRLTLFVSTSSSSGQITDSNLYYFVDQRVMLYTSEVKQGVQEATEQQTQDLLDSDSPASATYNNDYSTNSYDSAESAMDQNLDQDVSGLTFNPTSWAQAFSYIWSLVTSFITISNKVFITITTFLTFSFVGLVIGRS